MNIAHGPPQIIDRRRRLSRFIIEHRWYFPTGVDALHVRQIMGDTLVAIDTGGLARQQVFGMYIGGALRLFGKVHGNG